MHDKTESGNGASRANIGSNSPQQWFSTFDSRQPKEHNKTQFDDGFISRNNTKIQVFATQKQVLADQKSVATQLLRNTVQQNRMYVQPKKEKAFGDVSSVANQLTDKR